MFHVVEIHPCDPSTVRAAEELLLAELQGGVSKLKEFGWKRRAGER